MKGARMHLLDFILCCMSCICIWLNISNNYWIIDFYLKLDFTNSVFCLITGLLCDLGQAQCDLTFQGHLFMHIWHADNMLVSNSHKISAAWLETNRIVASNPCRDFAETLRTSLWNLSAFENPKCLWKFMWLIRHCDYYSPLITYGDKSGSPG